MRSLPFKGFFTLRCFALCLTGILSFPSASPASEKTSVLVLGVQHLSSLSEFRPEMLDQTINRLDSMNFNVIAVEAMHAELLRELQARNDPAFDEVLERFGGDRLALAEQAQREFKLTFPEAQVSINRMLTTTDLQAADALQLLKSFLATGDIASAVVQYEQLKRGAPAQLEVLQQSTKTLLEKHQTSANEVYALGVRLALLENVQRIEYIDNFQDEALLLKHYPSFMAEYADRQDYFARVMSHVHFSTLNERTESAVQQGELFDLLVYLNSAEFQAGDYEAQWQIWLDANFPSGASEARYLYWEMRNLQIAARVIDVTARHPGKKVLVIIGAAHKSFLEKFLAQIPTIQLLSFPGDAAD